ncbi:MAG: GNAT family N-acetyltransferase [Nocardioides sp.]|nr:GNAT family N-acetyltransferase [Nocardioides sp.]
MNAPDIRAVTLDDLEAVYDICLRTAASGEDASDIYTDPRLPGEVYAAPYLVVPEGVGFVAIDSGGVAGYVLGAADTAAFERACEESWWPALRVAHPDPGPAPATWDDRMRALIHRPRETPPELLGDYPAHLHIDLLPRLQGQGAGRALMETFLGLLHHAGVRGVHLGVAACNLNAIGFYRRLGFATLVESEEALVLGVRW